MFTKGTRVMVRLFSSWIAATVTAPEDSRGWVEVTTDNGSVCQRDPMALRPYEGWDIIESTYGTRTGREIETDARQLVDDLCLGARWDGIDATMRHSFMEAAELLHRARELRARLAV